MRRGTGTPPAYCAGGKMGRILKRSSRGLRSARAWISRWPPAAAAVVAAQRCFRPSQRRHPGPRRSGSVGESPTPAVPSRRSPLPPRHPSRKPPSFRRLRSPPNAPRRAPASTHRPTPPSRIAQATWTTRKLGARLDRRKLPGRRSAHQAVARKLRHARLLLRGPEDAEFTASGKPKDRFHFAVDTRRRAVHRAPGSATAWRSPYRRRFAPRDIRRRVRRAGFAGGDSRRSLAGDRWSQVDGLDVINGAGVGRRLQCRDHSPAEGRSHSFKLRTNHGRRAHCHAQAGVDRAVRAAGAERHAHFGVGTMSATCCSTTTSRPPKPAHRHDEAVQGRRHHRSGDRHALQRRRPARHRQRTGLHGALGRRDHGKAFERLQFNSKNPFRLTPRRRPCRSTLTPWAFLPPRASRCRSSGCRASRC